MGESLTMRRCVEDDGLRVVNSCRPGTRSRVLTPSGRDGTGKGSHGKLCASSRGNTEVASVVRIYWA